MSSYERQRNPRGTMQKHRWDHDSKSCIFPTFLVSRSQNRWDTIWEQIKKKNRSLPKNSFLVHVLSSMLFPHSCLLFLSWARSVTFKFRAIRSAPHTTFLNLPPLHHFTTSSQHGDMSLTARGENQPPRCTRLWGLATCADPDVRTCCPLLLSLFIDIILWTLVPCPVSRILPYSGESRTQGASPARACQGRPLPLQRLTCTT